MPGLWVFARKRARLAVGLLLSATAAFGAITAWRAAAASSASGSSEFSAEAFREHVSFLASDELKGRGNGTPEQRKAAAYIARWFKKAGLEPAGDNHTYFQHFTMTTGAKLGTRNVLTFSDSSGVKQLKVEEDFIPFSFSANGEFEAPLVFAGYGITAPDLQYDDYEGTNAKGKIVIVLRHEPQEDDDHSVFAGRQLTTHSAIVNKAINAKNHGALGMILVNDVGAHPGKGDELIGFRTLSGPEEMKLASGQVKASVADGWLKSSGRALDELRQAIDKDLKTQSFSLDPSVQITFAVDVERFRREVSNVVGILRGADAKLRDEAIVIGAHYDHLGFGEEHSLAPSRVGEVHHGADDNASGTSGLLELAANLARHRGKLERSVVFLAFAGEESGLLGSSYYTEHPVVSLDKTIAMLNMDMIGRVSKNKLYIGGSGTSPDFKEIVEEANGSSGFELSYSASGYGASDHMSFTVREVPVLFFFSGLHADYHKPSDTWEKIDAANGAKVAQLVAEVARRLDDVQEKPLFVRVAEPAARAMGGGGGGYGPYFGSIPDMSESENGVKFADIRDDSPASEAGFRGGDVLVQFGEQKVDNLYDFTYALRAHKPGDKVTVTVLRDGQRLTREVTLEVRR